MPLSAGLSAGVLRGQVQPQRKRAHSSQKQPSPCSVPLLLLSLAGLLAAYAPLHALLVGLPVPANLPEGHTGPFYPPQAHLTPHPRRVERPQQGVHFDAGVLHADGRTLGPEDAPDAVVEFTDFMCAHCQEAHRTTILPLLHHLVPHNSVRVESHPVAFLSADSLRAATAALCAQEQHKYWDMRELLFQVNLTSATTKQDGTNVKKGDSEGDSPTSVFPASLLMHLAHVAKLNSRAFAKCFQEGRYKGEVERISTLARGMGIIATPTFIVNDDIYEGPIETYKLYHLLATSDTSQSTNDLE